MYLLGVGTHNAYWVHKAVTEHTVDSEVYTANRAKVYVCYYIHISGENNRTIGRPKVNGLIH